MLQHRSSLNYRRSSKIFPLFAYYVTEGRILALELCLFFACLIDLFQCLPLVLLTSVTLLFSSIRQFPWQRSGFRSKSFETKVSILDNSCIKYNTHLDTETISRPYLIIDRDVIHVAYRYLSWISV